ncbi:hypothetical protein NU688_33130 [Variovorax sp. ZS18.2.2]|uniref:hypothetical protein n=1 Tax=Variovorax sp. ZS18.2.2 TaxID=2971255 RepID=UPI002151CF4B|nr:hypothetical protein [Variovorax sp. ZS18.2.2]MCR6481042.1 hypothetical protein [Variovorax sp. ZS18.2.2]
MLSAPQRGIVIQTVGEPDDLEVTGADLPEGQLEMLLQMHRVLGVTNQHGVSLELMFDMDQETLVAAPC